MRNFQGLHKEYFQELHEGVMKTKVMKENKNWPEPWKDNTAEAHSKTLLLQDFETHHAMKSDVFWKLDPLFQQYSLEFFKIHLDWLKIEIKRRKI